MEPSFIANSYIRTSAPSSGKVRQVLDHEEASYKVLRQARKLVRLPHASLKLNIPLKPLDDSRHDIRYTKAMQRPKDRKTCLEQGPDVAESQLTAVIVSKHAKRKDALAAGRFARSAEVLPSRADDIVIQQKQTQFRQGADLLNKPSEGVFVSSIASRKATRRRFQHYLYDFHSRQVFSFSENEVVSKHDDVKKSQIAESHSADSDPSDGNCSEVSSSKADFFARRNNPSRDSPQRELHEHHSKCLLDDLDFMCEDDYDAIFETDWNSSKVEKIVRDAVDRKRIREILRKAYRMLLWFFRYYAGNTAFATARTSAIATSGEGLFEIASPGRLLEDLNVQCVDGAKFGVSESPLKREGLILFILNVARMMCVHSPDPNRLKIVINEGIEMSDAVRTLVHGHFSAFAQIQDVDHFRSLFLRKPDAFVKTFRVVDDGEVPRMLDSIIEQHKQGLAGLFDELISMRSGGKNDKNKSQQQEKSAGIEIAQFLYVLRAINLITSRYSANGTVNASASDDTLAGNSNGIDEIRAVRIFLSCLPLTKIVRAKASTTTASSSATVTSSTNTLEPRGLTLSQLIEALLRVAFTWKELQICHGSFDVCPDQMTSSRCQCTFDSARYAFDVFATATEEILSRIHGLKLKRTEHQSRMKTKSVGIAHFAHSLQ